MPDVVLPYSSLPPGSNIGFERSADGVTIYLRGRAGGHNSPPAPGMFVSVLAISLLTTILAIYLIIIPTLSLMGTPRVPIGGAAVAAGVLAGSVVILNRAVKRLHGPATIISIRDKWLTLKYRGARRPIVRH